MDEGLKSGKNRRMRNAKNWKYERKKRRHENKHRAETSQLKT